MALKYEHFMAYTSPSDLLLRFYVMGVYWVHGMFFVSVMSGHALHLLHFITFERFAIWL